MATASARTNTWLPIINTLVAAIALAVAGWAINVALNQAVSAEKFNALKAIVDANIQQDEAIHKKLEEAFTRLGMVAADHERRLGDFTALLERVRERTEGIDRKLQAIDTNLVWVIDAVRALSAGRIPQPKP